MGGQPGDLSGDTLRDRTTQAQEDAATRAVLRRYDSGSLTAAQALDVLQALGLRPYSDGGSYDSNGRHDTSTDRPGGTT